MLSQELKRAILRYTVGVGGGIGVVAVGVVSVATNIPLGLFALVMAGVAVFFSTLLFSADTGIGTIDEGAEAGFLSDSPSESQITDVSFPGRVEIAFALLGFGVVGALTLAVLNV